MGDDNLTVQQAMVKLAKDGVSIEGGVTISPGDIEIGAVEIKDATTDNRVSVDASGSLKVITDPNSQVQLRPTAGTRVFDETTQALTAVMATISIIGAKNILIQNNEPSGGGKIYWTTSIPSGVEFEIPPQSSIILDNILLADGSFAMRGDAGGESYSVMQWGLF